MTKPLLLLLACATFATPALAQAPWSDPTGAFSMKIPPGWIQGPEEDLGPGVKSKFVLNIEPKGPASKGADASAAESGCSIYRLDHTAADNVTQEMANGVLKDWDQGFIAQQSQDLGSPILGNAVFSNKLKDGVQLVSFAYDSEFEGHRIRASQIQFMLATGGASASFYTAACQVPAKKGNPDIEKAKAFLSSLRFKTK